jgi:hypothetical protein
LELIQTLQNRRGFTRVKNAHPNPKGQIHKPFGAAGRESFSTGCFSETLNKVGLASSMLEWKMMHKSASTTHGPTPETASPGSMFRGVVTRLRIAVKLDIPVGYQDETGFHLGVKPAEYEIKWPPVW